MSFTWKALLALISAPSWIKYLTASNWPFSDAKCNGVFWKHDQSFFVSKIQGLSIYSKNFCNISYYFEINVHFFTVSRRAPLGKLFHASKFNANDTLVDCRWNYVRENFRKTFSFFFFWTNFILFQSVAFFHSWAFQQVFCPVMARSNSFKSCLLF